jgi:hypothetical protein
MSENTARIWVNPIFKQVDALLYCSLSERKMIGDSEVAHNLGMMLEATKADGRVSTRREGSSGPRVGGRPPAQETQPRHRARAS